MASSQSAFEKRERAAEEVFFMQEERAKMISRLEKLVEQGRLDKATLDRVKAATSPDPHHSIGVEVSPGVYKDVPAEGKKRGEYVYDHKPGGPPVPRISETERLNLVSHVDMGPGRWNPGGEGSIFSFAEGARMAQAPPHVSPYEQARMAKIAKAMTEAPTLFGVKVVPTMTPGRAFFWGSILAVWGTAALVAAGMRTLGVASTEQLPEAGARTMTPMHQRLADWFLPWRTRWGTPEGGRRATPEETGEFVRRLRESMIPRPSA